MKTSLILALSIAFFPLVTKVVGQDVRVRSLCFKEGFPVELYAYETAGFAKAGMVEIKSFLNHEESILKLKTRSVLFTRKSNPASATDVNEVIGKVDLPPASPSCILLFMPESNEPGNYQSKVVSIDDSAKSFPPGSFKVVNLGSLPVKIELEKESYEIPAGESKVIDKPPYGENQSVAMTAFCKRDEKWQTITSSVWLNPGTRRVLQLITEDPVSKQVEIKGIRDVVVP